MRQFARIPFGLRHQGLQGAGHRVKADPIAVAHTRQRTAHSGLRGYMDSRRHITGRAAHAPIGDQRHLVTPAL